MREAGIVGFHVQEVLRRNSFGTARRWEASVTLEDLAIELPNGFHDSEFKTITIDYDKRRVVVELSVWLGDMHSETERERYRDAELAIEGLQFMSIEPPDPRYKLGENRRLWVDLCAGPKKEKVGAVSAVSRECFVSGFFVADWNSFIYVAAREASLRWIGEAFNRGKRLAEEP